MDGYDFLRVVQIILIIGAIIFLGLFHFSNLSPEKILILLLLAFLIILNIFLLIIILKE